MNRRRTLQILCGASLLPSLARAAGFSFERPLMGTLFKITTYTEDKGLAQKATAEAFAAAEKINSIASDYIADSELLTFSKLPPRKTPFRFRLSNRPESDKARRPRHNLRISNRHSGKNRQGGPGLPPSAKSHGYIPQAAA